MRSLMPVASPPATDGPSSHQRSEVLLKQVVGHSVGRPLPTLVFVPSLTGMPCNLNHDPTCQPTDGRLFAQQLLAPVESVESEIYVTPLNSTATPLFILEVQPSTSDKQPAAHSISSLAAKKCIVATSLMQDHLGTSVADLSQCLSCASSWESFIHDVQGPSYLASTIQGILHLAATYLE